MSAPISEAWFSEKVSSLIGSLAKAIAAHRLIANEEVREVLAQDLHHALYMAMKIASAGDRDPSLFTPARVYAVWENPDSARELLFDLGFPMGSENVNDSARRRVEDARRWNAGERPSHWTDDKGES